MMENSTEVKETCPQTTIGQEYIVESHCDDKLFCEKNLFFECLLCEAVETYSKLSTHLTSKDHRFKFLVSLKYFKAENKLLLLYLPLDLPSVQTLPVHGKTDREL